MYRMLLLIQIISNYWIIINAKDGYWEGSVHIKDGAAVLEEGTMDKTAAAYGFYNNTLMSTGWGILEIKTREGGKQYSNHQLMYASGYLEGVFTAEQMWLHYQNVRTFFIPDGTNTSSNSIEDKYRAFLKEQDTWTRKMIKDHGDTDPLWRHVDYVTAQLDGLFDGYKSVAMKSWEQTPFIVQFLNAVGDLIDIRHVFDKSSRPQFHKMSHAQLLNYVHTQGHCSALVKVLPAFENLYMSHSSWFTYSATMRIYKHYHFNLNDKATSAKEMSFSSYPGFLESLDDFYLMSSDMVLLQTTNNVFNTSLYDLVVPQSLLAWQRVRIANMMANSGRDWYKYFKQFNSGTYNNQYMIIDLKQVDLNRDLGDDTLWVVEQIPGLVVGADQTNVLRTGYWPSYNVPYYEAIYNQSGYPFIVATKGTDFSYQLAPRAKIFRRDQGTVKDMDSMKHIMRYNDYKNDEYSEGNACNTICCRGDLNAGGNAQPDGCYDTKVSDFQMAMNFKADIINGPTLGNDLPAFSWTGEFAKKTHKGLPDVYDFDWQTTKPVL